MNSSILLNDILNLSDLSNTKIKFNMSNGYHDPLDIFKSGQLDILLGWQYWNSRKKSFSVNQTTVGFVRIKPNEDLWLLFHVGVVNKDLNRLQDIGWEWETLSSYDKYVGRLIVRYKNRSQNMIRWANSVLGEIEVHQILPYTFDNDIFPGYDRINLSYSELQRVITKDNWKVALQNQKGIYLITDRSNGKKYVGSAYGQNMILGRWEEYVSNGHGGNIGLRGLDFDYIRKNFSYSILDIYKGTTGDEIILEREVYWKNVLGSREFGYNMN
jgi:hypothetical protein